MLTPTVRTRLPQERHSAGRMVGWTTRTPSDRLFEQHKRDAGHEWGPERETLHGDVFCDRSDCACGANRRESIMGRTVRFDAGDLEKLKGLVDRFVGEEGAEIQIENVKRRPVKQGTVYDWTWRNRQRPAATNRRSTMAEQHEDLEDLDYEVRNVLAYCTLFGVQSALGVKALTDTPTPEMQESAAGIIVKSWRRRVTSDGVFYSWQWADVNDMPAENERTIMLEQSSYLKTVDGLVVGTLRNLTMQAAGETIALAEQLPLTEQDADGENVTEVNPETGEIPDPPAEKLGDTGFTRPPAAYSG